jgi:hypothetical protein
MKSHLSEVDQFHADYPTLRALEDEIVTRCGGLATLQVRFPLLVRDAVDFLLDSVRTARTRVTELDNVEKTFIGLKLEHFVRDMLDVPKGLRDLVVNGTDVDIKNTVGSNWSIPQETYRGSEPCLLMAVNDASYTCSLGLIVAKPEYLHKGKGNRDTKKGVCAEGFKHIRWLVAEAPFATSRFAGLDMARFRDLRKDIASGKDRASQFFRENLFRIVHRDVVHALLYDQYDYMKRIRANGGAPDDLGHEDIAILIGTYTKDRIIAVKFGVPNLERDEVVAVRPRSQSEWQLLKDEGEIFTNQWTA